MDAHEDCVALSIGSFYAKPERNKNIFFPSHHDVHSFALQISAEPVGDIEVHALFGDSLSVNATMIMAAMPGIDNDGRETAGRCKGRRENKKRDRIQPHVF